MMDWPRIVNNNRAFDGIAVIDDGLSYSYHDFFSHVFSAALKLERLGAQRVAIRAPQDFFSYTMIWACYLSGVVFCPIGDNIPEARYRYYLEVFEPDLIIDTISSSTLMSDFFTYEENLNFVPASFDSNKTAYVIFTSGSTGKPKGVRITRYGFENFLSWSTEAYCLQENDVYGQYSSLGFDLCLMDIFTGIICKTTLIPFGKTGEKLLPALKIKKYKITFWHSVPTVVDLLNNAGHLNHDYLSTLKTISFCGEKLYPSQISALFSINPSLTVFNTYGPTETTLFCTFQRIRAPEIHSFSTDTVSIGQPIPGYHLELINILDGIGEMVICGHCIGQGYLPDNSPSSSYGTFYVSGQIMPAFYSGDFAKIIDNNLYFIERKDSQIKIKGNRVDFSEINNLFREFGCIAAVSIYNKGKIISYVIDSHHSHDWLMENLANFLPSYYLPAKIIFCNEFPYLPSGKVDMDLLKLLNE